MITNKTIRDFVISKKLFKGSEVITDVTIKDDIVTFESNNTLPLKECTCFINPIQEGTGDPSPSNERPITGFTGLNVTQTRKNLVNVAGRTITSQTTLMSGTLLKKGTYTISADLKNNGTIRGQIRFTKTNTSTIYAELLCLEGDDSRKSSTFTLTEDTTCSILANGQAAGYNFTFGDLQVEVGNTPTTYEPYTGSTYTVNLGQTVYGGSADVVGGSGEARPYYESYNGETLVGPWICSEAVYPDTPPIGSQVVDMGGVATDFTFTPKEIRTSEGENTFYHDGNGEIEVTYQSVAGQGDSAMQYLPLFYGKKQYRKET